MTVKITKPEINIREKLTELEGKLVDYPKGTINNPYRTVSEATANGAETGLYYFVNRIGQTQELFYDSADGGWVLYTSNDARDTLFPLGTSRNTLDYTVNRNGTFGQLGTANPEADYIIGSFIDNFTYTTFRILGWGWDSVNSTYSFFGNRGTTMDIQWPATSMSQITPVAQATIVGDTPALLTYLVGDAILMDYLSDGSITANSNQCTIGAAGVVNANGSPANGCYIGHGAYESTNSCEGWYNSSNLARDSQGYTSWVR